MYPRRILILALPFMLAVAPPLAQAQQKSSDSASSVVRVGKASITEADISERMAALATQGTGDPATRREEAIRQLIAEYVVEQKLDNTEGGLPPELLAQLGAARRQQVFAWYMRNRLVESGIGQHPSADEVDAFVRANPRFFAGRAQFRFVMIGLTATDASQEAQAVAMLSRLPQAQPPSPAQMNDLRGQLQMHHWLGGYATYTQNSEQLAPTVLDRLERMAASHRFLDVIRDGGQVHALVLQARVADPVDPAVVGDQVALGLARKRADEAGKALIAQLSDPIYQQLDPAVKLRAQTLGAGAVQSESGSRALLRSLVPNVDYFVLRRLAAFFWWLLWVWPLAAILHPLFQFRQGRWAERLAATKFRFGAGRVGRAAVVLVPPLSVVALFFGLRLTLDASRDSQVLALLGAVAGGMLYPLLCRHFSGNARLAALMLGSSVVTLATVL